MKLKLKLLACTALVAAGAATRAADDIVLDTFDFDGSQASWARWWGAAPQLYEWDATMDADGNPASGALKVTIDFDLAAYGGDNQFAALRQFPQVDGAEYTNIVMDIYWDPSSPQRPWGDFGGLEVGYRHSGWSSRTVLNYGVPTTPGWLRITAPIDPLATGVETMNGLLLKMWSGAGDWGQTGRAIFWVDNVKLIARTDISAPPPVMSVERAKPGLQLHASAPGSQYQRQSIRTRNPAYSWIGAVDPVTYSITFNDYPGTAAGFQAHLFIVPGSSIPNWENAPDWNEPNCVFVQFGGNPDGSGYAAFRFKTNQPNGNSMYWSSGTIGDIGSGSIRGTWNLTFSPDGTITLAEPNGGSTNFTMDAESAALFGGPAYAYFGVQPNDVANIGRSASIGRIAITGLEAAFSDDFSGRALNTDIWEVIAEDAAGVVQVGSEALFWLSWTLPDRDFLPKVTDDLLFNQWYDIALPTMQLGGMRRALVYPDVLPALPIPGQYFFRLEKPAAQ